MRMVSAREIIGRRIVAFDPGTTMEGHGVFRRPMHDPSITLDDGSVLIFVAEEHPEGHEYGVFVGRAKRKRKPH